MIRYQLIGSSTFPIYFFTQGFLTFKGEKLSYSMRFKAFITSLSLGFKKNACFKYISASPRLYMFKYERPIR